MRVRFKQESIEIELILQYNIQPLIVLVKVILAYWYNFYSEILKKVVFQIYGGIIFFYFFYL